MIYAYIRVNTSDKSFEDQRLKILDYTNTKNIAINKWIEEVASGLEKIENRLLGQTLDNLSKGDTLIVTEVTRLGRNLVDVTNMLHSCENNGVHIHPIQSNSILTPANPKFYT